MKTNEVLSTQDLETDLRPGETLVAYGVRTRPIRRSLLSRVFGGTR